MERGGGRAGGKGGREVRSERKEGREGREAKQGEGRRKGAGAREKGGGDRGNLKVDRLGDFDRVEHEKAQQEILRHAALRNAIDEQAGAT